MSQEKRGYSLKVERGFAPSIYSTEYQDWRRATMRRDDRAAADADRAWKRRFRPVKAA